MSVDINSAYSQANQLKNYVSQLNVVLTNLNNYKSSLDTNWQGNEVKHLDNSINIIKRRIQTLLANLNSTADNIIRAANQIRQEEIQAEQRRQAEIARRRAAEEARRREVEQQAAQQKAAAEAAAKEEKAMNDMMDKINKVKSKTKRNKLIAKSKENGITAAELEEYYNKIMGK